MKLQTLFILILASALIFAIIGGIIGDFRTHYPEVGEVNTSWESKFDKSTQMNKTFSSLQKNIEELQQEKSAWIKILDGLQVFAVAVIATIKAVIFSPLYVIAILSQIATDLGMPAIVTNILLPIFVVMLIGSVIILLVKFLHRSPG